MKRNQALGLRRNALLGLIHVIHASLHTSTHSNSTMSAVLGLCQASAGCCPAIQPRKVVIRPLARLPVVARTRSSRRALVAASQGPPPLCICWGAAASLSLLHAAIVFKLCTPCISCATAIPHKLPLSICSTWLACGSRIYNVSRAQVGLTWMHEALSC